MNIFSALLEVTVYSAVLFALVLLLKRIFQKRFSPSLQYFVWFLLLARPAVPFTVESGIGFFTLPQSTFSAAAASASGDELSGSTASARPERMESMQAPQTETISHTAPASAAAAATESADAGEPSGDAEAPSTQTAPSSAAAPPGSARRHSVYRMSVLHRRTHYKNGKGSYFPLPPAEACFRTAAARGEAYGRSGAA